MNERPQSQGEELANSVSHGLGFILALASAPVLIVTAAKTGSSVNVVGASIFAVTMVLLYCASTLYHATATDKLKALLRKLDHGAIFLLIAGTYTPFGLVALDGAWRVTVLAIAWTGAFAAIVIKVAWIDAPRWVAAVLAVGLGWVGVFAMPQILDSVGVAPLTLIAVGGVFYMAGALIYSLKRPDPIPSVFGYHEIFHALVVAAAACQYVGVALFVT
jgi:hemolysin III